MREPRSGVSTLLWGAAALSVGLLLVVLLIYLTGMDLELFWQNLIQAHPGFLLLICLSTFLHFYLSACKWRLVADRLSPGSKMGHHFLVYSGWIGLLGQVLPMQFCVVTVRSLAARWHDQLPLGRGAVVALFDQLFDFLVPCFFLLGALVAMSGVLSPGLAAGVTGALVVIGLLLVIAGGRKAGKLLMGMIRMLPMPGKRTRMPEEGSAKSSLEWMDRTFLTRLSVASVARYLNLVFRSYLVVLAVGLPVGFLPVFFAMPVVVLSIVISVTPASLGIAEWGWAGVLTAFGIETDLAARYALLNRVLVLLSVVVVNGLVSGVFYWMKQGDRE
jgi:uncharacterized membrane protein YbhN (UPF0104 family)